MSTTVKVQIQQRIDTASAWTTANPTLLAGEVGWESDTKKYKIGDGSTAWASLTYAPGSGGYTAGTGVSISASNVITASAVALTTVQTAANQTAHLALTTQEGDVVVRSDENKSYVRNSGTAGSMADFTLLATPTDAVLSVNGNTGAITADQLAAAIEAASDSNTFTDADHTKLNSALTTSDLLDEDNFATNSATKAASQQSVKAYVDTADALKANLSGATFTGTVVFTGDAANVTWDKSTDDLIFNDNAKAIFGTSSDGVSIYHDGSNSYILNSTGELQLRDQSRIKLRTDQFVINNFANDENIIYAAANGSVELYEDGVKKAETTSDGFNVEGTLYANGIDMDDNHIIKLGLGDDLQIYHDGNHSYLVNTTGNIYITDDSYIELSSANGGEKYATFTKDGAAELYYDNSLRLSTTSAGVNIGGNLSSDSGTSFTVNAGGASGTAAHFIARCGSENAIVAVPNGAVEIYYDNSKKFETVSWGARVTGTFEASTDIQVTDAGKFNAGSSNDLQIYNNGLNSYVANTTGYLFIQSDDFSVGAKSVGENMIVANVNDGVDLYFDGSKKFETTSTGNKSTGQLKVYNTDDANHNGFEVYNDNGNMSGSFSQNSTGDGTLGIQKDDGTLNVFFRSNGDSYINGGSLSCAGTVSDSKGDLRNIPINSRTGAYTLVVGDAGKVVGNTTGGWTIPASVFTTVGQTVTLLNNSGSDQNITASALTYLYNTADGANIKASTIALGARAMATIWFDGGATGYIQSSKITVS